MSRIENQCQNVIPFLEENLPYVDPETLGAYSILQREHPEILYAQDFDIPQEQIDFFASRHFAIYAHQAEEILQNLPLSLVLCSGMFGGKTTLSFLLLDNLMAQGKNVAMLIADVMGEDYVTARSYKGGEKRPATRFGFLTDYKETIEKLRQTNVEAVFLDEFSFLDVTIVEELQEMCLQEKKNLILTGLNTSYLGQLLPAFCGQSDIVKNSQVEECFSFVPRFCEEEPLGTSTIRYVKILDKWILDIGLLPLVVSKEKSHIVHYGPAMLEHTAIHILQDYPELLNSILYPSQGKIIYQKLLLEKLSEV